MKRSGFLVVLLAIASTLSIAQQPTPTIDQKKLDNLLAKHDKPGEPGGVLLILRNGKVAYTRAFGLASVEQNVRNTRETVFSLDYGECREFTAMTVAMLAEEGKLSLDDPIRKYIPELPSFASTITLRNLIHNASGLFDYGQQFLLTGWMLRNPLSNEEFLRLIGRQRLTAFPAGEGFMYSNTDYALLAFAVQRATGKSLRFQADRLLFKPLGMNSTQIDDQFGEVAKGRAYEYFERDGTLVMIRRDKFSPSGRNGVLTKVDDLGRWANAINDPASKLGKAALKLRDNAKFDLNRPGEHAFGHFIKSYRGVNTISHQGISEHPYLVRVPDRSVSIIYLTNGGFEAGDAMRSVLDEILFGGPDPTAKPILISESQLKQLASTLKSNPDGVAVTSQEVAPLAGGYSSVKSSRGKDFVCEVRGNSLVEIYGDEVNRMTPLGNGVFHFIGFYFVFEKPGQGESVRLRIFKTTGELVDEMRRVPSIDPPSLEVNTPLVGKYYNYELDVTWSLVIESGKLAIKRERMATATLWPSAKDRFILTVLADSEAYTYDVEVRINRDSGGGVTGFSIWSGRLRGGLEFKRV